MIGAAFLAARRWLAALPSGVKWAMAGIAGMVAIIATGAIWLNFHDAAVVEQHEVKREAAASGARERSAEERAIDAVTNFQAEQEREAAIARAEASEAAKPPELRAVVPPTTIARRCAQLLRTYSSEQLAKMAAYQEKCR